MYGDEHPVQKIERRGHVQKRMGTRLRNLVSRCGKRPLTEGETMGGRGRLIGDQIKAITQYYGSAIKDNLGDLKSMREAVWTIWFHKGSLDEHPVHNFCCTSWCPLKQAQTGRNFTDLHAHKQPVISHHGWAETNFQRSSQNRTVTEVSSWLHTKCKWVFEQHNVEILP